MQGNYNNYGSFASVGVMDITLKVVGGDRTMCSSSKERVASSQPAVQRGSAHIAGQQEGLIGLHPEWGAVVDCVRNNGLRLCP